MNLGASVPEFDCAGSVMMAMIAPLCDQHIVVDLHQIFDLDLAHVTLDLDPDQVTCEVDFQLHHYRVLI